MLKFRQNLIHLFLKLKAFRFVGDDFYGNRYYEGLNKRRGAESKTRRIVIYKGQIEASKISPDWYGWMHHTCDVPLQTPQYDWLKPPMPNLTGTIFAHQPQNLKMQKYYEAWQPDNKE